MQSSPTAMLAKKWMEEMLVASDSHLDASELFSLSEVVGETPVVELASVSLQFEHCQCYFGFSRFGW